MRAGWDSYFTNLAHVVATRATCDRKHVGAVVVRDRTVLSTGYNGSIRGLPHCDDVGHLVEEGHCVRTVHAEANAILQAAKNGVAVDRATLYVTASPCWPCFGLVVNAGIVRVVFGEAYRTDDPGPRRVVEVARVTNVELVQLAVTSVVDEAQTGGRVVDDAQRGACCDHCKSRVYTTCACRRCTSEPTDDEKFHACRAHRTEVGESHFLMRGRPAVWV